MNLIIELEYEMARQLEAHELLRVNEKIPP